MVPFILARVLTLTQDNCTKSKPGLTGFVAGAKLLLELPAGAPPTQALGGGGGGGSGGGGGGDSGGGGRSGQIVISYLSSYVGMGAARVACHGGCACQPFELDAHRDARHSQQQVSVFVTHTVPAQFHGRTCGIEVEVLNITRSGGFKFKVKAVTVHWDREEAPGDADAAARTEACRQVEAEDLQEEAAKKEAARELILAYAQKKAAKKEAAKKEADEKEAAKDTKAEGSPKVEHVFAVGDRVRHKDRGLGTVGEHMLDGRTAIVFEGGEMHRYKQSSMHKIELVEAAPVNAQDMQTTGMSGMFASSLGVPFIDANSPSRIPAPFNIRQGAKTSDEARGEYSYRSEHSYQTEEPAVSSRSASPNIGRPRTLTREDELLRQDLIRSMSGMPQMGPTIYPPNDGLATDGASALVLRELQAMRRQIDTLNRRLEEFAPAGGGGGGDGGDGGDGGGGGNGRPPVQPVVFEAVSI